MFCETVVVVSFFLYLLIICSGIFYILGKSVITKDKNPKEKEENEEDTDVPIDEPEPEDLESRPIIATKHKKESKKESNFGGVQELW